MRGPEGGKGRLPNRKRRPRLRLDHRSDIGRPDAADEMGRAVRVQRRRLPIKQAEWVVRSERIGRRADYAIDEHTIPVVAVTRANIRLTITGSQARGDEM